MRRLILIVVALIVGIVALSHTYPGAVAPTPMPTITPTPLVYNATLIAPFTPTYNCELQQADVYSHPLCLSERIDESVLATQGDMRFIQHTYYTAQGCWDGVTQVVQELRTCNRRSGAITTLTKLLSTDLIPSPNGKVYVFGTMNPLSTAGDALDPHVYRVQSDGSGLEQLDSQPFPSFAVGPPFKLHWLDDDWLYVELWDGNGDSGYHPYRLKADGSGLYEPFCDCTTPTP